MSRLRAVRVCACGEAPTWPYEGRWLCAAHWRAALDAWGRAREAAAQALRAEAAKTWLARGYTAEPSGPWRGR